MKKGPGIPTWLQWAWYLATFIDTKGKQNQKNQFPTYTVLIEYTWQTWNPCDNCDKENSL